ncbi:hypothetical protein KP509_25G022400 [Ceratopteris richardii]|uniref:Uncharacterized protein n=1 Tax=Ceratopteris richardii TaxID=49495 RepID=A0A8T2RNJ1_CERRI|nr:hypothetical protein KP509_25G022400 [Ceratopteris richardii]
MNSPGSLFQHILFKFLMSSEKAHRQKQKQKWIAVCTFITIAIKFCRRLTGFMICLIAVTDEGSAWSSLVMVGTNSSGSI